MGNFLSSRDFLDDLHKGITNCCGNVRPNQKGMHMWICVDSWFMVYHTKTAFLKTVWHYAWNSSMQNISTVIIPLLTECLQFYEFEIQQTVTLSSLWCSG
jgi:hypothetical protein